MLSNSSGSRVLGSERADAGMQGCGWALGSGCRELEVRFPLSLDCSWSGLAAPGSGAGWFPVMGLGFRRQGSCGDVGGRVPLTD